MLEYITLYDVVLCFFMYCLFTLVLFVIDIKNKNDINYFKNSKLDFSVSNNE